jgi:parallel beta-helix repeat protein
MVEMTKAVRGSLLSVLILLTCFAGQAAGASVVVVGNCRTLPKYATIQVAVNSVPAGSTIYVCPGTYPEQVVINKQLTLTGYQSGQAGAAVVVPPAGGLVQNGADIFGNPVAAQIFVEGATGNVTIKDLTVDGTGNNLAGCGGPTLEGIYFQNSPGTISYNVVRNQFQTDFVDYGGCQNGLAINVESMLPIPPLVTVSANSVRAYQKNGITATGAATGPGATGPNVTISGNYIVGLGATAMNWPGGAAENGIQVGFGASGKITTNTVNDNIWFADTSSQPGNAASGILIYASTGVTITGNSVGSAQFGITTDTDPTYGPADHTIIQSNKVMGTQIFDAIDACSSSNTVVSNTVFGSAESGIHLDDSCGSGNTNTVTGNIINEGCAGILTGTGTGNTVSPNTFYNVTNTTLAGDVCPVPQTSATERGLSKKLRPSPYNPIRK